MTDPDQHVVFDPEAYESEGVVRISRRSIRLVLTRYLFEQLLDREPDGYLIRICDTVGCQNPHHFVESPGTRRPKDRGPRRPGAPEINAAKTHCPAGHEYTPENTYVSKDSHGTHRKCRACTIRRVQESRLSHTRERLAS